MNLWEFFLPPHVQWTTDAQTATTATGGRYLGLSVCFLAVWGAWKHREARIWFLFSVVGLLLSMGSIVYGMAFPFLFLNHVMDALARPLTQPTRYLCLALIGFAICVSYAVSTLSFQNKSIVLIIIVLDMFVWGGASLTIPQTKTPVIPCTMEGPVLLYPYDAQDGELSTSQLFQLIHEQPAAHTGIASWALPEGKKAMDKVRGAGFSEGTRMIRFSQLYRLGYRWILSKEELRGRGASTDVCGDFIRYRLQPR